MRPCAERALTKKKQQSKELQQNLFAWGRAGEGEFGVVHKALWNGSQVAAKILKGSSAIALGDFRSEIEVLRKVHHPNAVQFLGALEHSFRHACHNTPFIGAVTHMIACGCARGAPQGIPSQIFHLCV